MHCCQEFSFLPIKFYFGDFCLRQKARLIYPEWRRMEKSEYQREQKETFLKKKTASKTMHAMSSIYCSNKHVF